MVSGGVSTESVMLECEGPHARRLSSKTTLLIQVLQKFQNILYGNATFIFFPKTVIPFFFSPKTVIPMGVFISDDNQGNLR